MEQYGEGRGTGYGVRDDAAAETGEYPAEQAGQMTRFQKVASAGPSWQAQRGTAPGSRGDYWDEPGTPGGERDDAVAVTSPDATAVEAEAGPGTAGQPATVPDMFGTEVTPAPAAEMPETSEAPAGQGASATLTAGPEASAPADGTPTLGDFSDLTYGNLIPDAAQYTDQWHQVQYRFVDDPHASVTEAADIIAQVAAKLEAAIQERQRAIEERQRAITEQQRTLRGRWGDGSNADTEVLRETLRMYRTFLDQLIGRRAG